MQVLFKNIEHLLFYLVVVVRIAIEPLYIKSINAIKHVKLNFIKERILHFQ
jgi:hypothetical protein